MTKHSVIDGVHDNPGVWPDLYREAADEIARLRGEAQSGWQPYPHKNHY